MRSTVRTSRSDPDNTAGAVISSASRAPSTSKCCSQVTDRTALGTASTPARRKTGVPQTPVARPLFRRDQRYRWPCKPLSISRVHGLPPLSDADSRWTHCPRCESIRPNRCSFGMSSGGDDTTNAAGPRVKIEGAAVSSRWSGRVCFFRPGSQCLPTATGETLSCSKPPDAQRPDLDRTVRSLSVIIFDTC